MIRQLHSLLVLRQMMVPVQAWYRESFAFFDFPMTGIWRSLRMQLRTCEEPGCPLLDTFERTVAYLSREFQVWRAIRASSFTMCLRWLSHSQKAGTFSLFF